MTQNVDDDGAALCSQRLAHSNLPPLGAGSASEHAVNANHRQQHTQTRKSEQEAGGEARP